MANKSNIQIIEEKLRKDGSVDNFWCIDNRITIRLGAVIFVLKGRGWAFDDARSGFVPGTKNWRYVLTSAPQEKKVDPDFIPGVGIVRKFQG